MQVFSHLRCQIISTSPNILKKATVSYCPRIFKFLAQKMSSLSLQNKDNLLIGTHDGVFHCDEVLGCFLLKVLFPKASIKRSRNVEILKTCDIVIDVGGEYDPRNHRYDHHQRTFHDTMSTLSEELVGTVRLSSAGLVYHHFGKEVLQKILDSKNEDLIKYVYRRMYNSFIKEIDGIDNGVPAHDSEPVYTIHTDLSSRVGRLYKPWYFEGEWNENEHFQKAMDLVGSEFTDAVLRSRDISYRARDIVKRSILDRYNVHESGAIIELSISCPWKEHFFELEKELAITPEEVKYVLFKGEDSYRIMGVPLTRESFLGRKFMPESWRGLRNEDLSRLTGVEGCIFVHATGFIGGNTTRDGVLQMAIKSLES